MSKLLVVIVVSALVFLAAQSCSDSSDLIGPGLLPLAQITSGGGFEPTISPDGQFLAFSGLGSQLIVRDLTSGAEDTMRFADNSIVTMSDPDWSPQLDTIAFLRGGLFVMSLSTGDTIRIASGSNLETPDWSPLGTEILTNGRSPDGAYLTTYPGGATNMVPCIDPSGFGCAGEGPSFSGDGQWFTYEDGLEIMKVPRTGDTATAVVFNQRDVASPAWSPNGFWIAFVMQDSSSNDFHIWVVDARSQVFGQFQITTGNDDQPTWSPDSKTLYFERTVSGSPTEIWRVGFSP